MLKDHSPLSESLTPFHMCVLLPSLSPEGLEKTFATNHLGHFYLTESLLPLLSQPRPDGQPKRIVILSSGTHDPKSQSGMPAPYCKW